VSAAAPPDGAPATAPAATLSPARIVLRVAIWAMFAAIVAGVAFVGLRAARERPIAAEIPVYGAVPEFSLRASTGEEVSRETLLGRPWVVDFIFTRCAGTCPVMTSAMSDLSTRLESAWELRFLSITVDPDRDTPEVLSQYAQGVAADPKRWIFATGEKEAIYALSQNGFKLGAAGPAEGSEDVFTEEIMHSTRFVLVDETGMIRGYYDGTSPDEVKRLEADVRALLGQGGRR
jgi:protein SCO1/2